MRRYSVAAGISFHEGCILLGRRIRSESQFAGYWEFPGGKIEEGESDVEALRREFMEELGVEVLRHQSFIQLEWAYPDRIVDLNFFLVELSEVQPALLKKNAHSEIEWMSLEKAMNCELLPANVEVFQKIKSQMPIIERFFDRT